MFPGDTCLWYLSSLDPVFFCLRVLFSYNNRCPAKRVNYKSNFQKRGYCINWTSANSGHLGSAGSRPRECWGTPRCSPCKFRRIFSHWTSADFPYNVHNLFENFTHHKNLQTTNMACIRFFPNPKPTKFLWSFSVPTFSVLAFLLWRFPSRWPQRKDRATQPPEVDVDVKLLSWRVTYRLK